MESDEWGGRDIGAFFVHLHTLNASVDKHFPLPPRIPLARTLRMAAFHVDTDQHGSISHLSLSADANLQLIYSTGSNIS